MKIGSNLLVGLVVILGIGMIHAGPDGAPPEACTTMAPEYEVDAQEGPCPFEIVALQVIKSFAFSTAYCKSLKLCVLIL